jgi:DHA2 family multidrug resistance protein-like MFS transporter
VRKRSFIFGLALFTGSSLACGLAGSTTALGVARAVQGVGAAALALRRWR